MPSLQLQEYLRLRFDGTPVEIAAERSGIGLAEAQMHEEAIEAGELALPGPTQETPMPGMTNEEEERETPQPFIRADMAAISKLIGKDGRIDKLKEKMDKARGELGTEYQKIENDFHGNRAAVKLVHKLTKGTINAAYDFMRTFLPLCAQFGLLPEDDLVDLAHNQKSDSEEEPGISAAETAPRSADVHQFPAGENAIDRAKKAMAGGDKPPAPKGPEGDTDLVEAADATAEEIQRQREEDGRAFDEAEQAQATVN